MDLEIKEQEVNLVDNDLAIVNKNIIEYVINHWQTIKGSETVLNFTEQNLLTEIDSEYGSKIYFYKSNPFNLDWIEGVKNEIIEAITIFNNQIAIQDINILFKGSRTVNVEIYYIDNTINQGSNFTQFDIELER